MVSNRHTNAKKVDLKYARTDSSGLISRQQGRCSRILLRRCFKFYRMESIHQQRSNYCFLHDNVLLPIVCYWMPNTWAKHFSIILIYCGPIWTFLFQNYKELQQWLLNIFCKHYFVTWMSDHRSNLFISDCCY